MVRYQISTFKKAFEHVGIESGDLVLVHNSLFAFGVPEGIALNELSEKIFEILQEKVGLEGTIVVPAFNFDFCKGVPFDRKKTPPKLMGNFSEYVFSLPQTKRSFHPLQSVCAIGRLAEEITKYDTPSAFEKNSAWYQLLKKNTKIILLGSNFNSASIFHLVEEEEKVPYRYWKSFSGTYIDGNEETIKTYPMYVREQDPLPVLKMAHIEQLLEAKNMIKSFSIGNGRVLCFQAADFVDCIREKIRRNPYYFVGNHHEFLKDL